MALFGRTRTHVTRHYAVIAEDGQVRTPLPGWTASESVMLISPQLGARFTQYLAVMDADAKGGAPLAGVERFLYVVAGSVALTLNGETTSLSPGGYAYLPPDTLHTVSARSASRLVVFERRYVAMEGVPPPPALTGDESDLEGEPFLGDADLRVRKLLPESSAFDMAVNTMTFAPGTPLPFVETHVMEHGLLMLSGGGIYRLGEHWHPVTAGDVIWMGPYCPQWFGAMGKESARYLLYKDVNRDPFAFERGS